MLNYMALAGYDAETSMKMLPNVLNLAAAGGLELATASDMVTDASSALGLSIDETSAMVDKMAKASSKTNTSVGQLGDAILTVGGTAKNLAGGTTELATCLGILADNGIKASEGGTHLRNIILAMNPTTDDAVAAFRALGVSGYDAQGNLRSLGDTFGDLSVALSDMTMQDAQSYITKIFNKTDLSSVSAMLAACAKDTNGLKRAMELAGLSGEDFGTSFEYLYTTAKSFGTEAEFVNHITGGTSMTAEQASQAFGMLNSYVGDGSNRFDELMVAIDSAWYSLDSLNGQLGESGLSLDDMKSSMEALGVSSEIFDEMLATSGGNAEIFAASLLEAADTGINLSDITDALGGDLGNLQQAFDNTAGAAQQMAETQLDNLAGDIQLFQSALEGVQIAISDRLTPSLRQLVKFGSDSLSAIEKGIRSGNLAGVISEIISSLADNISNVSDMMVTAGFATILNFVRGITSGAGTLASASLEIISVFGDKIASNTNNIAAYGSLIVQDVISGLASGSTMLASTGAEFINNLSSGVATAIPTFLGNCLPLLAEFSGTLRANAGTLIDAGLNLIQNIVQGITNSIPVLVENVPTIITNIAGIINDNAPKLLETGIGIIQALAAGVVSAIPTIVANIPKILQAIVNVFMAFNWLQLGGGIITLIKNGMTALANAIPATFQEIGNCSVSFLKGIQWSSVGRDLIAAIQLGIEALASSIPDALLTIANTAVGIVTGVDWLTLGINIVSGIASGLLGAVQIAVNAITNIASSILDTFCGFFGIHSPSTVMKEQGSYIVQGMVNGVGELPGELLGILNDALGKVLDWGNNLASNALNAAQKMLGNVTTTLSKLPENIQGYLSNVISTTVAWERDLTSNAKSAATNMANAVVDSIKALPGKVEAIWISITKTVSAELSAIKTSITSAWDSIKSTVSSAVAAIKSTVSSGWDSIKSTVSGAGAAILNSVKNNWNSIKNSISSTMTAAKNSAVAVWNGIGSTFSSIGKNIVSGIVSGITNAASSLYGSLKSLAKNALSSAKDALGIHSPSAVMRDEVGKWIPEGVAAGISANIDVVLKATDGIAKGVSSSLSKAKGEAAGEKFAKGIIGGITGQKKYAHASAAAVGDAIVSTAQKKLKNYQTIHDTTAAYEVGFWEKILKSCKNGTQAYYDAYAKHASALDSYNKGMTESRKNLVALEDEYAQNVAKIEAKLVSDMNSLWDTYHSTVDSRAKELCQSLGGLFNAFSSETENTTEILLNNMRSQVDGMMQWQASLEELEKRCVDSKLIEELRALGPEASANIELLSRMSDAELETYVALWQKKMELCRQQATTESQGLYADTLTQVEKLKKDAATEAAELTDKFVASVKDLAKKTKTELGALPKEFKSVGKDAVKGITTAIKENGSALTDEVRALMTSAVKAAKDELEIKSPSRVFRDEVGKWIPKGVADGIEANADDAIDAVDDLASMISDTKPIDFDIPVNFDFEKFGIQMESAVRSVRGALIDEFKLGSISANAQFSVAANVQERSRDNRLDRLLELVDVMTTEIRDGKNIVLDDGTLVGRMSKKMDAALAGRRTAALRGR